MSERVCKLQSFTQMSCTVMKSFRMARTLTEGAEREGPLGRDKERRGGLCRSVGKGKPALQFSHVKAAKEGLCFQDH